jgi:hypothetical protein
MAKCLCQRGPQLQVFSGGRVHAPLRDKWTTNALATSTDGKIQINDILMRLFVIAMESAYICKTPSVVDCGVAEPLNDSSPGFQTKRHDSEIFVMCWRQLGRMVRTSALNRRRMEPSTQPGLAMSRR